MTTCCTPDSALSHGAQQTRTFLLRFWRRYRTGAGIREIKDGCGFSSTSLARRYLLELEAAGHVVYTHGRSNTAVPAETGAVPVPANGKHGG